MAGQVECERMVMKKAPELSSEHLWGAWFRLLLQPRLHGGISIFGFPCFQNFVVATFGFYYLIGVRVFIDFYYTYTPACLNWAGGSAQSGWIKDINRIFE